MKKYYFSLIAACLLLCGCNDSRLIEAFSASDAIRLQVGGAEQFRYEPLTCQLAFSYDRKTFRALTDNASDFFVASFNNIPGEVGQIVTANLSWTTMTDIVSRKNLSLEVIKIDGDKIWLWSKSGRIGLCITLI